MPFMPKRVIFEKEALQYPLGENLLNYFQAQGVQISYTTSHNRVTSIPGKTRPEGFLEGKRTLVVGVRRTKTLQTCRPSAHFQLPLATSCPGRCEYCYLMTNLGKKPYVRIYVNIDEILAGAHGYIEQRKPEITVFEGAATSDPVPTEPYTGLLARVITFFGEQEYGRFRFVTKFTDIDTLLELPHRGHTRFRFSLNTEAIIRQHEHGTPVLTARLSAAKKVAAAGYPLGFIVAPIIASGNWKQDYREMFKTAAAVLDGSPPGLTFELITHRFTRRAKQAIQEVYPDTTLDLNEETRTFKFGQFGYGKYVYPLAFMREIREYFNDLVKKYFPAAGVDYLV